MDHMGKRGPKSGHEQATAHLRTVARIGRAKIACPRHLPRLARECWDEVVSTKPAAHFMQSDAPLLEAYCLQYAIQRSTQSKVGRILDRGGDLDPTHTRLLASCAQRLSSLSTKLRLAPNARVAADARQDDPLPAADDPMPPPRPRAGLMFEG